MTFTEIESRFYQLTGQTAGDISDANLNLLIGEGTKRVVTLINLYDRRWQFDDSNYSDLPIATAALVSGQQDYNLATSHLSVDRIEVKTSGGDWRALKQIDQQLLKRNRHESLTDYRKTDGTPEEYDLVGNSIFLYPAPNYSQAASLKVFFTRDALLFDYTDDKFTDDTGSATSVPGFASAFHDLIPLWASYDYLLNKKPQEASNVLTRINTLEQNLKEFYGERNRDHRGRMTTTGFNK